MAQNGLIIDAAVVLPSSLHGICSDVCRAHHCFTPPLENLLAKLGTVACFPWLMFSYSKCLDALCLWACWCGHCSPWLAQCMCEWLLEGLLSVVTWWGGHSS